MENKYIGKLFLIVGPSGSGKGTVIENLKSRYAGFVYPVSYTTRDMREGEQNGEVYNFVSRDEFERMIKDDELLEYAIVHSNNYYGTSKKEILDRLEQGAIVIREVDIQGFEAISQIVPSENLISIFMKVSDLDDLRQRIDRRGKLSDEEMERRMDSAKKELAKAELCDYQIENVWGKAGDAVRSVEKIILEQIDGMF